ncbi:oligopeptide/dipeptide ABC transporter ATP-binding protein [Halobaculum litoreum]|uniref:Oligopeptide/dipeptide ABC transporter ATP-binding protein n=1 Tax=Halobaculum litoreum TaxID=3031998 RepID=A0ABD5XRZ3_9EURY
MLGDPKHPYTQVLRWATADLDPSAQRSVDPPVRSIDIPDPVNPPSGCRFHTRCPEARAVCAEEAPTLDEEGAAAAATVRPVTEPTRTTSTGTANRWTGPRR